MSTAAAVLIVAAATAVAVAAMLFARSHAPAGGRFTDSDRASSVMGVIGVGFAIILGFVVLLAFESYSNAKTHSEDEASALKDMFESIELLPAHDSIPIQSELVCYGRAIVGDEWPAMRHGGRSALVEEWIFRTERLAGQAELGDRRAQEGFSQFFNARNTRDQARRERLLEAQHVLPPLLWVMLLLAAALPIACVLLYADPKEDRVAQAFLAGSVVALITASLLAVRFLDTPFHGRAGSIRPTAMRYTVNLMFDEMRREDRLGTLPCDARGRPSAA